MILSTPKRASTVLIAEKQEKLYMLLARENIVPLPGKANDPKWLAKKAHSVTWEAVEIKSPHKQDHI